MYLETIYVLSKTNASVRSLDVAEYMGFSKPSVSRAVGLLKYGGYILVDKDGFITLTESGMEIANRIYERHKTLTHYFMFLGVDEETAREDACKVEHDLSNQTYDALKRHAQTQMKQMK